MIILAMDLSLSSPAFSVIEKKKTELNVLHISHIKTNPRKTHGYRLFQIYNHMKEILDEYGDVIEKVVSEKGFSRHQRTTQILFMVHGISKLLAHQYGFEVIELAPTTVKKQVAQNGKASKDQVADAVQGFISHYVLFKNDDESDSVAVGVAYLIDSGNLKIEK
jgi:crossover junction endodeoxyribonuclease RuvC